MSRNFIAIILGALVFASFSSAENSLVADAEILFEQYIELNDAFNPSVANLYADSASIKIYRRYPHGLERAFEVPGWQWKRVLVQSMPLAKAKNDRSEYREPTFKQVDNYVIIRAQRYSFLKCYLDPNYYMVVERQDDGSLKIEEEYAETQPQSDC